MFKFITDKFYSTKRIEVKRESNFKKIISNKDLILIHAGFFRNFIGTYVGINFQSFIIKLHFKRMSVSFLSICTLPVLIDVIADKNILKLKIFHNEIFSYNISKYKGKINIFDNSYLVVQPCVSVYPFSRDRLNVGITTTLKIYIVSLALTFYAFEPYRHKLNVGISFKLNSLIKYIDRAYVWVTSNDKVSKILNSTNIIKKRAKKYKIRTIVLKFIK